MSDQSPVPGGQHQQPPVPPVPPAFPPAAPAPPVDASTAPAPAYGAPPAAPAADVYGAPPAAPPGAYGVPVGGYPAPMGGYAAPPAPPASKLMGVLSLLGSLLAAVVIPVIAGIVSFQIGTVVPVDEAVTDHGGFNAAVLAPVRGQVLVVEVLFWTGTIVGVAAIVLGIVAAVRGRGRGLGITGAIISLIGPIGFFVLMALMWGVGSGVAFAEQYS